MRSRNSTRLASSISLSGEADNSCRVAFLAERGKHDGHDAGRVETSFGVHGFWLVLLDERIGQGECPDSEPAVEKTFTRESMQYERAESAGRAFLDGDEHLVVPRKIAQQMQI